MKQLSKKFGIHGRDELSVERLGKEGFFSGHYFFVGEDELKLKDNVLMDKMYNSVALALGHSNQLYSFDVYRGKLNFLRKPALVLLNGDCLNARTSSRAYVSGSRGCQDSFKIGEAFSTLGDSLSYSPILLLKKNEEFVRDAFEEWCTEVLVPEEEKNNPYWKIGAEYFIQDRLIKEFSNEVMMKIAEN